ncbi:MAG TPA: hypothetical protein P5561_03360 [Candidatus Omnitrophota bacterium]|nr:hypothetical protein [Candidatus Omnitrophota bacterium]HRY85553.1 hypothetical protein [Candidatus Omnitrophota bacterium]
MQANEAERLRKEWGAKPCEHPKWEKEYILGSDTGDKVCSQCGALDYDIKNKKKG